MPFPELLLVPNEHKYAGDVHTHHLAQRAGEVLLLTYLSLIDISQMSLMASKCLDMT